MQVNGLLDEAFGRLPEVARGAVDGLDDQGLLWRPEAGTNPIGWLVWHLTRVQDDHVAELAEQDQVWVTGAWAQRFGLPEGTTETGYGHTPEQVAAVRPQGPDVLIEYLEEVTDRTRGFLSTLDADDLDRVVDTSWDPPVTMAVRLVSVIEDSLQHAGQAALLRGMYDRTA